MVFPYLDTCDAGDGGLIFLPGSHRSQFSRPRTLFGPYGRHEEEWARKDWAQSSADSVGKYERLPETNGKRRAALLCQDRLWNVAEN